MSRSLLEPEVFAEIFDRYAPALHRFASRRLGDEAADDVVSETFLTAFQHRRRYNSGYGDARPWLYGIATNVIRHRRRTELSHYQATMLDGARPTSAGLVEDGVTTLAVNRPLVSAIAGLKPGDRDVLLLVAWAEFTYEETARALSIPVGTVRSRLNRARTQVRTALEANHG
ncbi:RNA polymerase sigma factor [Nonomuraea guangzhouensis]|uniref:RNA polymerase sigma factor n=1 Tax=Nonomuraea guangzhouensis TaxID=1291555 RepID=A0ABW4FZ26_9ACTN|nr:sigma-70 family RNA polymerase sigma factor [Nonomuraea guangzhouensis]